MDYAEYRAYDAVGLAALVAKGEVSAAELLTAASARAEDVDGRIGAIVRPMHDVARARAAGADRAVRRRAVPDQGPGPALRGPADRGRDRAAGRRPGRRQHSEVVRRWLDAGLVVFGKTSTPEFGAKAITEPVAGPTARNPWDLTRTPGRLVRRVRRGRGGRDRAGRRRERRRRARSGSRPPAAGCSGSSRGAGSSRTARRRPSACTARPCRAWSRGRCATRPRCWTCSPGPSRVRRTGWPCRTSRSPRRPGASRACCGSG